MKLRSSAKATMSNCGPPHPSSYQAHPSVNALRCLHALEGRPFACRPPAPSTNNDDEGMNSSPCQNGGSPPARSSSRGYPPPSDHFPSSWTPHCEVLTSTAGNITAPRLRGLFIFIGDRIAWSVVKVQAFLRPFVDNDTLPTGKRSIQQSPFGMRTLTPTEMRRRRRRRTHEKEDEGSMSTSGGIR